MQHPYQRPLPWICSDWSVIDSFLWKGNPSFAVSEDGKEWLPAKLKAEAKKKPGEKGPARRVAKADANPDDTACDQVEKPTDSRRTKETSRASSSSGAGKRTTPPTSSNQAEKSNQQQSSAKWERTLKNAAKLVQLGVLAAGASNQGTTSAAASEQGEKTSTALGQARDPSDASKRKASKTDEPSSTGARN